MPGRAAKATHVTQASLVRAHGPVSPHKMSGRAHRPWRGVDAQSASRPVGQSGRAIFRTSYSGTGRASRAERPRIPREPAVHIRDQRRFATLKPLPPGTISPWAPWSSATSRTSPRSAPSSSSSARAPKPTRTSSVSATHSAAPPSTGRPRTPGRPPDGAGSRRGREGAGSPGPHRRAVTWAGTPCRLYALRRAPGALPWARPMASRGSAPPVRRRSGGGRPRCDRGTGGSSRTFRRPWPAGPGPAR